MSGYFGDDGGGVFEEFFVANENGALGAFFCLGDAFVGGDSPEMGAAFEG